MPFPSLLQSLTNLVHKRDAKGPNFAQKNGKVAEKTRPKAVPNDSADTVKPFIYAETVKREEIRTTCFVKTGTSPHPFQKVAAEAILTGRDLVANRRTSQ